MIWQPSKPIRKLDSIQQEQQKHSIQLEKRAQDLVKSHGCRCTRTHFLSSPSDFNYLHLDFQQKKEYIFFSFCHLAVVKASLG